MREVHSFAILQDAANNHPRSYGRLGRVDHLQFEQAVIQQNALPHFACHVRLGCPAASFDAGRHFLILNRHPSRLADNIIGGEFQLFTGNQRDTPRLHFAHTQFRPLQIDENRYRPVPHLRNLADRVDVAGVKLMIAMAHIDACHIHASVDHLGENLGISAGRPYCTDNFDPQHSRTPVAFGQVLMARIPRKLFPGPVPLRRSGMK